MSLKVPYLADTGIEASANALLADCARRTRIDVRPPVPVEDILEDHLGLHLGFDDLRARLGMPDVLGALCIERAEVTVDQTLDPDEHPSALNRYRFTLGHEIGHWDLHRGLVLAQRLQTDLFQKSSGPSIVCRASQRKEPIEWQADAFAAALLMPRSEVAAHWQRLIGPERLEVGKLRGRAGVFLAAALAGPSHEPRTQHDALIEFFIRPMAKVFEVSPAAMRIRLEQLGFIVHDIDTAMSMFEAV
jgi:Zn-dependent peptidase ImmA (M78 family)